MKKFLVEYESLAVLFGDRYSSKIVEAENEKNAINLVDYEKGGLIKNARATELPLPVDSELLYKLRVYKPDGNIDHEECFAELTSASERYYELRKSEWKAPTMWIYNGKKCVRIAGF